MKRWEARKLRKSRVKFSSLRLYTYKWNNKAICIDYAKATLHKSIEFRTKVLQKSLSFITSY